MKLPSIHYLIAQARNSLMRFPLTLFCAVTAVVLGIILIEYGEDPIDVLPYINVLLCLAIGIPLYFCVAVIASKKKFDRKKIIYANLAATSILVALYFTFPSTDSSHNTTLPYIKYGLYNATCHLLVAVVPFAFSKQLNGFWHYNKILFLRLCLSVLYSGFIYIGLIIALTALNLLFDIYIHNELYAEIWIATIGIFNTWFFVSGIPEDFDHLDAIAVYPKGLRIFSQYVLLPLLGLYLLILYAYGSKIIITADWPKGIVAYLIIFVSILGIFTFLLLHPYGQLKESTWIKKTSKGYYFVLIPLLVLLYIAIFMRINDYGITISRYAVLMLAIWISAVCLYTALGKTNIKFIPTSLAVLAVLISFGPWGMFSVSERSQTNRLRTILEQSKILVDGKIKNEPVWIKDSLPKFYANGEFKNEGILTDSLHNEVKSIVEYLDDHHGFASIQPWYKQDIHALLDLQKQRKKDKYDYYIQESGVYIRSMGLKDEWFQKNNTETFSQYNISDETGITVVTGYDYLIDFNAYRTPENLSIRRFTVDQIAYELSFSDKTKNSLVLKSKNESVTFQMDQAIESLRNQYGIGYKSDIPASALTISGSNAAFEIKIQFKFIGIDHKKQNAQIDNMSGQILIKKK